MDTIINSHIIPVNTNESTDTDTNGTTIPLDTNQAYGTTIPLDTNQAYDIVKAEDHVYATLEDEENASHNEDYDYIT